jgi:hypothetical protein
LLLRVAAITSQRQLCATLTGWSGPELLLLADAIQPAVVAAVAAAAAPSPTAGGSKAGSSKAGGSKAGGSKAGGSKAGSSKAAAAAAAAAGSSGGGSQAASQQQQLGWLLSLLTAGLLPRVGRADELSASSCVRRGAYKAAVRRLMMAAPLLPLLPRDAVRSLALTYWQQVRGLRVLSRRMRGDVGSVRGHHSRPLPSATPTTTHTRRRRRLRRC